MRFESRVERRRRKELYRKDWMIMDYLERMSNVFTPLLPLLRPSVIERRPDKRIIDVIEGDHLDLYEDAIYPEIERRIAIMREDGTPSLDHIRDEELRADIESLISFFFEKEAALTVRELLDFMERERSLLNRIHGPVRRSYWVQVWALYISAVVVTSFFIIVFLGKPNELEGLPLYAVISITVVMTILAAWLIYYSARAPRGRWS